MYSLKVLEAMWNYEIKNVKQIFKMCQTRYRFDKFGTHVNVKRKKNYNKFEFKHDFSIK